MVGDVLAWALVSCARVFVCPVWVVRCPCLVAFTPMLLEHSQLVNLRRSDARLLTRTAGTVMSSHRGGALRHRGAKELCCRRARHVRHEPLRIRLEQIELLEVDGLAAPVAADGAPIRLLGDWPQAGRSGPREDRGRTRKPHVSLGFVNALG